jgi:phenylpyruvate tautomerase PptA (4-oxalocrotonate tautomerase family)
VSAPGLPLVPARSPPTSKPPTRVPAALLGIADDPLVGPDGALGRANEVLGYTGTQHPSANARYSGGSVMPFVRIDLMRGKSIEYRKTIGEIVYNAMRDVIDVPKDDKFQVIAEHPVEAFNVSASYLGNDYSKDLILIQITLNAGRSVEQKKAFYKRIVDDMNSQLNVRPQDVVINLVEVAKENWSFGSGIAQYAA